MQSTDVTDHEAVAKTENEARLPVTSSLLTTSALSLQTSQASLPSGDFAQSSIQQGPGTVASLAVPCTNVPTFVEVTSSPQLQATTIFTGNASSAFISGSSRPVSTPVIISTMPSAISQNSSFFRIVPTHIKSQTTSTVTSRITTLTMAKLSDAAVKPMLPNTSNQDKNVGGLLKTSIGTVTIRGSTVAPLQPQTKLTVVTAVNQPSRSILPLPKLVPTNATVNKFQTSAPKIITQPTRVPFIVQSIPVSVSHTPCALTVNKKTAALTTARQTTLTGQNPTTIVSSTPTIVASNSVIANVYPAMTKIKATVPAVNFVQRASKLKVDMAGSAFTASTTADVCENDDSLVKRTSGLSSFTSFTSSVVPLTNALPHEHNEVSSVNLNQIPKPILVMESPHVNKSATSTIPSVIQPSMTTFQSYFIPSVSKVQPSLPRLSPIPQQNANTKSNTPSRPSILRKRDIDGSLAEAQRNLTPLLNSEPIDSTLLPPASLHMLDSDQQFSSSSTLSNASSPSILSIDSVSPSKLGKCTLTSYGDNEQLPETSFMEMSPRKKSRKQQLLNKLTEESKFEDHAEIISDNNNKTENRDTDPTLINQELPKSTLSPLSFASKKAYVSILTGYNQNWKPQHNHFLRYSDIKYKEEKKSSISDIANQKYVTQKINGWKIYHLSAQMEDLHDIEIEIIDTFSSLLKLFESDSENDGNGSLNRTNELFMSNMQRSKVVSDQLKEAKAQMMTIFDHKKNISDVINTYANKKTIKKKGRF